MTPLSAMKRLVAAGALGLALCHPAFAQQTIKIGSILSITGPASFLGEPEDKTLRMYVDKINSTGGVAGKKIELVIYDDGGDANKARTFATRLIEDDKVVAVVGGSTTGTTMAMIPVFEEAQVPLISLGGAIEIIEPVRKYTFKTPHTDKMACEKIFENLKQRNLTKIKNTAGIQAVLNAGFGQAPAIVTRNYAQLGMTATPLYQSHGVASKSFIELAGSAAESVRLPAAALLVGDKLPDSDAQKKVVVDYKKTYEDTAKQPVSTFGGHAYDGLFILVEAMKRANSTDPKKLRDEIEKTKGFVGTGGVVSMSPTDHLGLDLSAFRLLEIKGGDWSLLAPGT